MTLRTYLCDAVEEETEMRDYSNLNILSYKEIPSIRKGFLQTKNLHQKKKKIEKIISLFHYIFTDLVLKKVALKVGFACIGVNLLVI